MSEQRVGGQQRASLQSERGRTTMSDTVVAKIAGIAALEVEGIQMGGGSARTGGGFLDSVTCGGGGHQNRVVSVEVAEEEAAVELSIAVEYGKTIPQLSEAVRRNVISRVESLTGLRVVEVNITVNDVLLPEGLAEVERQRDLR